MYSFFCSFYSRKKEGWKKDIKEESSREGRKEGKKEGRKEGRKAGRKEGRKEGREQQGRKEGRKDRWGLTSVNGHRNRGFGVGVHRDCLEGQGGLLNEIGQ